MRHYHKRPQEVTASEHELLVEMGREPQKPPQSIADYYAKPGVLRSCISDEFGPRTPPKWRNA